MASVRLFQSAFAALVWPFVWLKHRRGVQISFGAAGAACVVRYLTETYAGWKGMFPFETTSLTLCMFVQAIVLSGVLQDYKEVERYPATLSGQLETIFQAMQIVAENESKAADSKHTIFQGILQIIDAHLLLAIDAKESHALPAYYSSLSSATLQLVKVLRGLGLGRESGELAGDVGKLRGGGARLATVEQTSFLPSAYVLYDGMVIAVLILLQITSFASFRAQYTNIFLFSLVFVYMSVLIRDADNPMDYSQFRSVYRLVACHGGHLLPAEAEALAEDDKRNPVHIDEDDDEVAIAPLINVRDRVVRALLDCGPPPSSKVGSDKEADSAKASAPITGSTPDNNTADASSDIKPVNSVPYVRVNVAPAPDSVHDPTQPDKRDACYAATGQTVEEEEDNATRVRAAGYTGY